MRLGVGRRVPEQGIGRRADGLELERLEVEMPEVELGHRAIGLADLAKDLAFALDRHLRQLEVQRLEG